ncbi:hypothetical protein ACM41_11535, partial [Bradyrhizobium sp. CCBAU 21362]|uniref:IS66 family transposase n=1 Tax=Bradyrhizobium sp. CCBAU 21362 TaxID=1325082 RepID=UPI0023063BF6
LNRQSQRFKCEGIDLSVSTLADQVGAGAFVVRPIFELIEAYVLSADRLHGDDTKIPILAKGKADTGRIWTYLWTVPLCKAICFVPANDRLQLSIRLYGVATSLDEIRGSAPNYVGEFE